MSAEQEAQEANDSKAEAQAATGADPKLAELEKQIRELRKENAGHRVKLKDQEEAQAAETRKKLEEQGEYKALLEKEQAERAKLALELASMRRTAMQQAAASAAGLPLDLAPRLIGDTEDELLADAKAMAQRLAPVGAPNTGATNPAGNHGQQPAKPFDPKSPPRLSQLEWKK